MIYEVWRTLRVEAVLDSLPKAQRDQFDAAVAFLRKTPYPSDAHELIWRSRRLQQFFFSYYDGAFPFVLRYLIDEYPTARMGVVQIYALDDFALPGDPVILP